MPFRPLVSAPTFASHLLCLLLQVRHLHCFMLVLGTAGLSSASLGLYSMSLSNLLCLHSQVRHLLIPIRAHPPFRHFSPRVLALPAPAGETLALCRFGPFAPFRFFQFGLQSFQASCTRQLPSLCQASLHNAFCPPFLACCSRSSAPHITCMCGDQATRIW